MTDQPQAFTRDLDELIAEESARNPEFARGVADAERRLGVTPQTWRIKPFTVEAMHWQSEDADNAQAVLDWLEALNVGPQLSDDGQSIILMVDGTLVESGSWVFRMPTGLVATGPDDWFHRQYAPAGHPEDYCHRCGAPNRPWSAPSPLWNATGYDRT